MRDVLGFHRSVQAYPKNAALDVNDTVYTYEDLSRIVQQYALAIQKKTASRNLFIGILAYRSVDMYAGLLGSLSIGAAYVPLNPKFPISRLKKIIEISNIRMAILGEECLSCFGELARSLEETIEWVVPFRLADNLRKRFPRQGFSPLSETTTTTNAFAVKDVSSDDYAYRIFTSGSTGVPKGIGVTVGNLNAFSCNQLERYNFNETDRFSQCSDISFDLSVQDLGTSVAKRLVFMCRSGDSSNSSRTVYHHEKDYLLVRCTVYRHFHGSIKNAEAGNVSNAAICHFLRRAVDEEYSAKVASCRAECDY